MKKSCLLFIVFFLSTTVFLSSQGYQGKGKIRGFVYDEEERPLEGVKVKLYSLKAGAGFETSTDKKGEWKALWIRGGRWNIDFEKAGYEPKKISFKVNEWKRDPDIEIKLKKIEGLVLTEELKIVLEKGNKLYDEKRYEEAIEVFQGMLQEYPEAYIIYLNIGNSFFRMEKYEEAEEYYKKVLEKDPENTDVLVSIGNCYINRGQTEEAMKWYNKVKFEEINNPTTLYNIGNSLYESTQYNEALKYYQRAVEIENDFLEARYQLGLTYIALGRYKEALVEFENYLEYDPDSGKAGQVKGFIEYLKKQLVKKEEN